MLLRVSFRRARVLVLRRFWLGCWTGTGPSDGDREGGLGFWEWEWE